MSAKEPAAIAKRLRPRQIKAIGDRVIGTASTHTATCDSLVRLGLFTHAGGGNYCGQSLRGRSRYDEMTYKRTELGEQVAVALGMVIR